MNREQQLASGTPPATAGVVGLVTVCVPTTGRLTYLRSALLDLAKQSYSPIETLILDNASAGEASAILQAFADSTLRARIIRVDQRIPMFENFNRGVHAARGEFVAFFHDDDEYDPDFLERMVEHLRANPRAVFAGGNYDVIDHNGALSRRNQLIARTSCWPGRRFIGEVLNSGRSPVSTPGLVFRASALAREGFDPALPMNWGDFTMLMRLAELGDVIVDSKTLYRWRVHGGNASNVAFSESIPLRTRVLLDYVEEFAHRHPADRALADRYRAMVRRTHYTGLLWGWLSTPVADDANRCRELLGKTPLGLALGGLLRVLESLGLSLRRRQSLLPTVRALTQPMMALQRVFSGRALHGASSPALDATNPPPTASGS